MHSSENRLFQLEMRYKFNPPDHPLAVLSIALLTGLFAILPVFYPNPEFWRSRMTYFRFALGSVGILTGFWFAVLAMLMLIDRVTHHATYPSEKVTYRAGYYVYKYFNLGCLALGVALSGVLTIHWFFQSPFFTFLYGLLLCFQGGYVLLRYRHELFSLYNAYRQINRVQLPLFTKPNLLKFDLIFSQIYSQSLNFLNERMNFSVENQVW